MLLFQINKEYGYKKFEEDTGYYNVDITKENKKVNSFPLPVLENDGDKYIFAAINIEVFTIKDLKLIKNVR